MPERLKIYIETSVISYLVAKPSSDPEKAAMGECTRRWWRECAPECDLFASNEVYKESCQGNSDEIAKRLAVITSLPFAIAYAEDVNAVTGKLREAHQMFAKQVSDAVHIAISAVSGMDMLLTWNCRHLANPHELPRTTRIVASCGYVCPMILTPMAFIELKKGMNHEEI